MMHRRVIPTLIAVALVGMSGAGTASGAGFQFPRIPHHWPVAPTQPPGGIHKIKHVIFIMQENRSFDSYFGMYPGADGIPRANGHFLICDPDPLSVVFRHPPSSSGTPACRYPYHDRNDENLGGPHNNFDGGVMDVDNGKMNGFMRSARMGFQQECLRTPRRRTFAARQRAFTRT